jgi:enterobactin synthetase component D
MKGTPDTVAVMARWDATLGFDPLTATFHLLRGPRFEETEVLAWKLGDSVLALPASLQGALPSRQSEYRAGRACAALALSQLGSRELKVPRRDDRSPEWPAGFTGSLSHTSGKAVALLTLAEPARSVGVDIENVLSSSTRREIEGRVLSEPEAMRLSPSLPLNDEERLTLVFSAKEACFKALYRIHGEFRDFLDLEVLHADEAGSLRVLDGKSGMECRGTWRRECANILSFVELVPTR